MAESEIASPLYSEGVHHAEVSSPIWDKDVPDPLGFLSSSYPEVGQLNKGSGDAMNDWKDNQFPDEA